jgi:hypothetical protein
MSVKRVVETSPGLLALFFLWLVQTAILWTYEFYFIPVAIGAGYALAYLEGKKKGLMEARDILESKKRMEQWYSGDRNDGFV